MDIEAVHNTGATLFATLQRTDDSEYWQEASTAWGAGTTVGNLKIALTEASAPFLRRYTGSSGDVGSPGEVIVRIHDDNDSDVVIGKATVVVESDEIVDVAGLTRIAAQGTRAFMPSTGPLLNATTAQTANESAIDARLPSGSTEIAGAGATSTSLDDLGTGITQQQVADAMLLTPTAQSQSLYNKAGGSNSIPVSQVPVPGGRTVVLQQTSTGLRGEFSKSFNVAEDKLFAVDFRKDMSVNQRFASIVAIELESGTEGGITFDEEEQGVDGSLVKFKAAAVTAGTYVIKITVTYGPNGEAAEGQVTLVVV